MVQRKNYFPAKLFTKCLTFSLNERGVIWLTKSNVYPKIHHRQFHEDLILSIGERSGQCQQYKRFIENHFIRNADSND